MGGTLLTIFSPNRGAEDQARLQRHPPFCRSGARRAPIMKTILLAFPLLSLSGNGLVAHQLEHPWGRWQPGAWIETNTTWSSSLSTLEERQQLIRFQEGGYDLQGLALSVAAHVGRLMKG